MPEKTWTATFVNHVWIAWILARHLRLRWGWMFLWLWPSATACNVSLGKRGFVMGCFFRIERWLALLCPACLLSVNWLRERLGSINIFKSDFSLLWPSTRYVWTLWCRFYTTGVFTIHLVLRRGKRAPEQGQIRQKSFSHQNNVTPLLLISQSSFSCPFKLAFVLLSGKQVPGWWVLTGRTSCVLGYEWLNQRHNKKRHRELHRARWGV